MTDLDFAGGELVHGGDGFELQTGLLEEFHQLADAFGGRGRHRDDDFFELEIEAAVHERFGRADHGDIMDARAPFAAIVIEESDGHESEAAFDHQLAGEAGADIACAENPDAAAAPGGFASGMR